VDRSSSYHHYSSARIRRFVIIVAAWSLVLEVRLGGGLAASIPAASVPPRWRCWAGLINYSVCLTCLHVAILGIGDYAVFFFLAGDKRVAPPGGYASAHHITGVRPGGEFDGDCSCFWPKRVGMVTAMPIAVEG
jgi:hypothetical protein